MKRRVALKQNYARAQILRIMRTVKDYKQCDLVPILGVTASYIAQVEKGNKSINDELIEKYLVHFGVDRQAFDKVEKKAIRILFREKVEMLKVVLLVVEMLINSKNS